MKSLAVALVAVSLIAPSAAAGEKCSVDRDGDRVCVVGIPSDRFAPVTAQQRMSEWCWAASIAMIFKYHGHAISQEDIVRATFGKVANLPASDGATMTEALARPWQDARGRRFQADVRVFDESDGREELDDRAVIAELRAERPLLVGTEGHAMVMTAMKYKQTDDGVEVLGITVRDPWPGEGRRDLTWSEMDPSYLAAVHLGVGPSAQPARASAPARESERVADASDNACVAQCTAAESECDAGAPSVQSCMQDHVEACVDECEESWGEGARACRTQFCLASEHDWAATCQRAESRAVRACSKTRASCVSACDGS